MAENKSNSNNQSQTKPKPSSATNESFSVPPTKYKKPTPPKKTGK